MAAQSIQDELNDYTAMFIALKDIIDEIPHDILMKRPEADKWSIKEILCHILDTEHNTTLRMKKLIAEDTPVLVKFDQDIWAEHLNYIEWDVKETLLLFGLLRNSMAGILDRLPEAAWNRTGKHEELGILTLYDLLQNANHHCKHHLAQIVAHKMKHEKS